MRRAPADRSERGNAVAEFALVAPMLILMVLGLLSLALTMHVRSVITDAAAEGARLGAHSGSPEQAQARTAELVGATLGAEYATAVQASRVATPAGPAISVSVRAPIPLLGLTVPGPRVLEAQADAIEE